MEHRAWRMDNVRCRALALRSMHMLVLLMSKPIERSLTGYPVPRIRIEATWVVAKNSQNGPYPSQSVVALLRGLRLSGSSSDSLAKVNGRGWAA